MDREQNLVKETAQTRRSFKMVNLEEDAGIGTFGMSAGLRWSCLEVWAGNPTRIESNATYSLKPSLMGL